MSPISIRSALTGLAVFTTATLAQTCPSMARQSIGPPIILNLQNTLPTSVFVNFVTGRHPCPDFGLDASGHPQLAEFQGVLNAPTGTTFTIAKNTLLQAAVPAGYSGVIDVGTSPTGHAANSIIESSYLGGKYDIDVSYVKGYSVSISCSCGGKVVTGCNKDLWALGKCERQVAPGVCANPCGDHDKAAPPFFRPCQGGAYTFPEDHSANANGWCAAGEEITCCIGPGCAPNPRQLLQ